MRSFTQAVACSSPIERRHSHRRDVDAIAGLLHLRERQPFTIYAGQRVLDVLKANRIFGVLPEDCERCEAVALAHAFRALACRWQRQRIFSRIV